MNDKIINLQTCFPVQIWPIVHSFPVNREIIINISDLILLLNNINLAKLFVLVAMLDFFVVMFLCSQSSASAVVNKIWSKVQTVERPGGRLVRAHGTGQGPMLQVTPFSLSLFPVSISASYCIHKGKKSPKINLKKKKVQTAKILSDGVHIKWREMLNYL